METVSVGQIVRLPHGEPVRVETVYEDGFAGVRYIDGDRKGTLALCQVSKLILDDSFESHGQIEPKD